jgi:hypothetical protein
MTPMSAAAAVVMLAALVIRAYVLACLPSGRTDEDSWYVEIGRRGNLQRFFTIQKRLT